MLCFPIFQPFSCWVILKEWSIPKISILWGKVEGHLFWECLTPRVFTQCESSGRKFNFSCDTHRDTHWVSWGKKEKTEVGHFEKWKCPSKQVFHFSKFPWLFCKGRISSSNIPFKYTVIFLLHLYMLNLIPVTPPT
jgi:hypothetical protein